MRSTLDSINRNAYRIDLEWTGRKKGVTDWALGRIFCRKSKRSTSLTTTCFIPGCCSTTGLPIERWRNRSASNLRSWLSRWSVFAATVESGSPNLSTRSSSKRFSCSGRWARRRWSVATAFSRMAAMGSCAICYEGMKIKEKPRIWDLPV